MSAETNKALVRREFEEMFCQGAISTPPGSFTPPTTYSTNRPRRRSTRSRGRQAVRRRLSRSVPRPTVRDRETR